MEILLLGSGKEKGSKDGRGLFFILGSVRKKTGKTIRRFQEVKESLSYVSTTLRKDENVRPWAKISDFSHFLLFHGHVISLINPSNAETEGQVYSLI